MKVSIASLTALFLFFYFNAFCQHQDKNWYFGDGTDGIIFDANNIPTKVSNKYNGVGFEGIAVVSHAWTGELLFYTDGITVINKNHAIMSNGSGLLANFSGTQSVQVCKVPGECSRYYIISNSSEDNTPGSFYYSIADFTSNNLGQITSKNVFIGGSSYHQAMTLIPKTNSNNFWLIGHLINTATYHVYEITPTGFVGPVTYNFANAGQSWIMDYNEATGRLVNTGTNQLKTTIFDFNASTGVLSNEQQIAPFGFSICWIGNFSPDGSKLYMSGFPNNQLWQYDFNTSSWLNMNTCCFAHDVKTGPDGITYHINTYNALNPLSKITNANLTAVGNACGYSNITNPGNFNGEVRRFPEFLQTAAPPVAMPDTISLMSGDTVALNVLLNDYDLQSDIISFDSIVSQPVHGTAIWQSGAIIYTGTSSSCTTMDSLIYLISDNTCLYDTAIVYFNIVGSNTASTIITSINPCDKAASFTLSPASNFTSYYWNFDDGQSSSDSMPVHIYSDTGSYSVSVVATDPFGCESTALTNIYIPPTPVAGFAFSLDSCSSTILFSNSSVYAVSYFWNFDDGNTDTVSSPIHLYSSGQYDVTLIAFSGTCSDSISTTINVPAIPMPVASYTSLLDTCNSEVTLVNTSSGNLSNQWFFSDGGYDTTANTIHTFSQGGNQTIALVVSNQYNCYDSINLNIFIPIVTPVSTSFLIDLDSCNQSISLTNNSSGVSSILWDFGDGNFDTIVNPSHSYSTPGLYAITLTGYNACFQDTATLQVIIPPASIPTAAFTTEIDSCLLLVSFQNQSFDANGYLWLFGDGQSSGLSEPIHHYSYGNYNVILIADPGRSCADTISQNLNLTDGDSTPLFIPNCFTPNNDGRNDLFTVSASINCQKYELKIFNRWGALVYEGTELSKGWDGKVNGFESPVGVYYCIVKSGKINASGAITLAR